MSLQHHAQRVADQNGLRSRLAGESGKGGIVGRDHHELVTRRLHGVQRADGDAFCHADDSRARCDSGYSAKKVRVEIVSTLFNVQHVIHEQLIVLISL